MSEQFYHLQRTIIFFNSKIFSISNCWVLLSHLIHVENDLPKFIWIASCQCLDMFFYDKFTTFPLLSQLFYAEYLTLLLFQWFRQGDLSIKLKNVLPQLIRSSSFGVPSKYLDPRGTVTILWEQSPQGSDLFSVSSHYYSVPTADDQV